MAEKACCLESCDMFDFMSDHVGLNILHPGGKESTDILFNLLGIDENMTVLDVACGKGLTSVAMAKKYGCKVVGIDILEKSIDKARAFARKHGVDHLIDFKVADAQKLPFSGDRFDLSIAQAMLILVDDKKKVIREVNRVLKPGGRSGWLELSWRKKTTKAFIQRASKEICAACIANVDTFDGWERLFKSCGLKSLAVHKFPMKFRGMRRMLKDEGVWNGLKVWLKLAANPGIRGRMMGLNAFFRNYQETIGYGIYLGTKK